MGDVNKYLKKREKPKIIISGEIIAENLDNSNKVFRSGSSDVIAIPSDWKLMLNLNDECEKRLVRVRIPKNPFIFVEGHLLIISEKDFPFELLMETKEVKE